MEQAASGDIKFPTLEVLRERLKDHLWRSFWTGVFCLLFTPMHQRDMTSLSDLGKFVIFYLGMTYQVLEWWIYFGKIPGWFMQPPPACPPLPPAGHFMHQMECWSLWLPGSFAPLGDGDSYVVIGITWVSMIMIMVTHQSIIHLHGIHGKLLFSFVPPYFPKHYTTPVLHPNSHC